MLRWAVSLALVVVLIGAGQAGASIQIFFGEDAVGGDPSMPRDHANAARDNFLASLGMSWTEGFDDASDPTPFVKELGDVTATLSSTNSLYPISIASGASSNRFPISGDQYVTSRVTSQTGGLMISFTDSTGADSWQTAVGFFATDVDAYKYESDTMILSLLDGGPSTVATFDMPQTLIPSARDGSVFFFGVIVDPGMQFNAIRFGNDTIGSQYDVWGLDDLTLGTPGVVPEPGSLMVWIFLGLTWAGWRWYRR